MGAGEKKIFDWTIFSFLARDNAVRCSRNERTPLARVPGGCFPPEIFEIKVAIQWLLVQPEPGTCN